MIRSFTVGLITAIATLAPGYAQTGETSTRIVHLTINWVDSTRPEPWTPDATDHRGILIEVYYRPGALEPAPLVLFSTGRNEGPKTYADLAQGAGQRWVRGRDRRPPRGTVRSAAAQR